MKQKWLQWGLRRRTTHDTDKDCLQNAPEKAMTLVVVYCN